MMPLFGSYDNVRLQKKSREIRKGRMEMMQFESA